MSLLNLEIDLCEQILAENEAKIRDYGVYDPEPLPIPSNAIQIPQGRRPAVLKELSPRPGMRAAAVPLTDRKGALLLVADYASAGPVSASPVGRRRGHGHSGLARGRQAFEITPGGRQGPSAGTSGRRHPNHPQGIRHNQLDPLHRRPGDVRTGSVDGRERPSQGRSRSRSNRRRSCSGPSRRSTAAWRPTAISSAPRSISSSAARPASRAHRPTCPTCSPSPKSRSRMPAMPGSVRTIRRLGGSPPGRLPAPPRHVRPLAAGLRRSRQGRLQDLSQARRRSRRTTTKSRGRRRRTDKPKIPRNPPLLLPPSRLSAVHLVLHSAGTLHLGRLDQGEARLSIRSQSRPLRRLRRSRDHHRVGLGRRELSVGRARRQDLDGAAR